MGNSPSGEYHGERAGNFNSNGAYRGYRGSAAAGRLPAESREAGRNEAQGGGRSASSSGTATQSDQESHRGYLNRNAANGPSSSGEHHRHAHDGRHHSEMQNQMQKKHSPEMQNHSVSAMLPESPRAGVERIGRVPFHDRSSSSSASSAVGQFLSGLFETEAESPGGGNGVIGVVSTANGNNGITRKNANSANINNKSIAFRNIKGAGAKEAALSLNSNKHSGSAENTNADNRTGASDGGNASASTSSRTPGQVQTMSENPDGRPSSSNSDSTSNTGTSINSKFSNTRNADTDRGVKADDDNKQSTGKSSSDNNGSNNKFNNPDNDTAWNETHESNIGDHHDHDPPNDFEDLTIAGAVTEGLGAVTEGIGAVSGVLASLFATATKMPKKFSSKYILYEQLGKGGFAVVYRAGRIGGGAGDNNTKVIVNGINGEEQEFGRGSSSGSGASSSSSSSISTSPKPKPAPNSPSPTNGSRSNSRPTPPASIAVKRIVKGPKLQGMKKQQVLHEVKMLSRCSHINIVQIFEAFESEIDYHFVLEFCPGGDLQARVEKWTESYEAGQRWARSSGNSGSSRIPPMFEVTKHISESTAADWVGQILNVLRYIHDLRICHRDVKPQNFMFAKDRKTLKLGDFGVAFEMQHLRKESTVGEKRRSNHGRRSNSGNRGNVQNGNSFQNSKSRPKAPVDPISRLLRRHDSGPGKQHPNSSSSSSKQFPENVNADGAANGAVHGNNHPGINPRTSQTLSGQSSGAARDRTAADTHAGDGSTNGPDNAVPNAPDNPVVYPPILCRDRIGTPAFMAPEMHLLPLKSRGYDYKIDVWATGVIMVFILSAQCPFVDEHNRLKREQLIAGDLPLWKAKKGTMQFFNMIFGGEEQEFLHNGLASSSKNSVTSGNGGGRVKPSAAARDMVSFLLRPDPKTRPTALGALHHPWLSGEIQTGSQKASPVESTLGSPEEISAAKALGGLFEGVSVGGFFDGLFGGDVEALFAGDSESKSTGRSGSEGRLEGESRGSGDATVSDTNDADGNTGSSGGDRRDRRKGKELKADDAHATGSLDDVNVVIVGGSSSVSNNAGGTAKRGSAAGFAGVRNSSNKADRKSSNFVLSGSRSSDVGNSNTENSAESFAGFRGRFSEPESLPLGNKEKSKTDVNLDKHNDDSTDNSHSQSYEWLVGAADEHWSRLRATVSSAVSENLEVLNARVSENLDRLDGGVSLGNALKRGSTTGTGGGNKNSSSGSSAENGNQAQDRNQSQDSKSSTNVGTGSAVVDDGDRGRSQSGAGSSLSERVAMRFNSQSEGSPPKSIPQSSNGTNSNAVLHTSGVGRYLFSPRSRDLGSTKTSHNDEQNTSNANSNTAELDSLERAINRTGKASPKRKLSAKMGMSPRKLGTKEMAERLARIKREFENEETHSGVDRNGETNLNQGLQGFASNQGSKETASSSLRSDSKSINLDKKEPTHKESEVREEPLQCVVCYCPVVSNANKAGKSSSADATSTTSVPTTKTSSPASSPVPSTTSVVSVTGAETDQNMKRMAASKAASPGNRASQASPNTSSFLSDLPKKLESWGDLSAWDNLDFICPRCRYVVCRDCVGQLRVLECPHCRLACSFDTMLPERVVIDAVKHGAMVKSVVAESFSSTIKRLSEVAAVAVEAAGEAVERAGVVVEGIDGTDTMERHQDRRGGKGRLSLTGANHNENQMKGQNLFGHGGSETYASSSTASSSAAEVDLIRRARTQSRHSRGPPPTTRTCFGCGAKRDATHLLDLSCLSCEVSFCTDCCTALGNPSCAFSKYLGDTQPTQNHSHLRLSQGPSQASSSSSIVATNGQNLSRRIFPPSGPSNTEAMPLPAGGKGLVSNSGTTGSTKLDSGFRAPPDSRRSAQEWDSFWKDSSSNPSSCEEYGRVSEEHPKSARSSGPSDKISLGSSPSRLSGDDSDALPPVPKSSSGLGFTNYNKAPLDSSLAQELSEQRQRTRMETLLGMVTRAREGLSKQRSGRQANVETVVTNTTSNADIISSATGDGSNVSSTNTSKTATESESPPQEKKEKAKKGFFSRLRNLRTKKAAAKEATTAQGKAETNVQPGESHIDRETCSSSTSCVRSTDAASPHTETDADRLHQVDWELLEFYTCPACGDRCNFSAALMQHLRILTNGIWLKRKVGSLHEFVKEGVTVDKIVHSVSNTEVLSREVSNIRHGVGEVSENLREDLAEVGGHISDAAVSVGEAVAEVSTTVKTTVTTQSQSVWREHVNPRLNYVREDYEHSDFQGLASDLGSMLKEDGGYLVDQLTDIGGGIAGLFADPNGAQSRSPSRSPNQSLTDGARNGGARHRNAENRNGRNASPSGSGDGRSPNMSSSPKRSPNRSPHRSPADIEI